MNSKTVVILHHRFTKDSPIDEQDVEAEVFVVTNAFQELGYETVTIPFSFEIDKIVDLLKKLKPLFVFNLVESVEGSDQLIHLAPSILKYLNIPHTGFPLEAFFLTTNKLIAKKYLRGYGIATPEWISIDHTDQDDFISDDFYIIKAAWDHASIGISEESIISKKSLSQIKEFLRNISNKNGKEFFAERYIEGREFNISILAGNVLPIPELLFQNYPKNKLKIVDYRAKWIENSFEFKHTKRSFDLNEEDRPLLERLKNISLQCWNLCKIKGYARVDFRVDSNNKPWILEINANPCLSPDGGFYASASQAGLSITEVIKKIIEDSI